MAIQGLLKDFQTNQKLPGQSTVSLDGFSSGVSGLLNNFDSQESDLSPNSTKAISQDFSISDIFKRTVKGIGGTFGTLGRILGIGQQATTGVIEKTLEKTGVLKDTGIKGIGALEGIKKEKSNVELLKRIGEERGGGVVTGQYTPTQSVFGNFVKEVPSVTIGTLADVFIDPLFLLGSVGAVKKATQETGKVIAKGATKVAEKVPAVQKVGDLLGRAFITRYGQREGFKEADVARKIIEQQIPEAVGKITSPIIEKPQFIQQRIAQVIKGGITTDDEIKFLAEPIREELDRVGESISKLNPKLLSEETFAAGKGTYFPRLYTNYEFPKEEVEAVKTAFGARPTSIPRGRFMARKLTEAEALATPELIKEAGFPATKGLLQLRVTETRQKFFNEIAKIASDEAKPGWVQLSDDKTLGNLAGKFLPAAEYRSISETRHLPSELEKIYSKALTTWKTFKTAYNPATIVRNDLTNFFVLNPLGGVGPHRLDIYARTAQEMLSKGTYYQMARKEGLEISTQSAAELTSEASAYYRANKGVVSQFFGKVGDFHNAVRSFYGSQDKFFKLANFIKGVKEDGLTPAQALKRANFYLVDYSEVPEFIAWARKSPLGAPFISFTYGVSKPLAKTLLERPDKLSAYYKILRDIQMFNPLGETPAELQREHDVLPDWISSGTFLRMPFKDKIGRSQYLDMQYILPFNIIETSGVFKSIFGIPVPRAIQPGTPFSTVTAAVLTNKDSFTGKELWKETDTEEEKSEKIVAYLVKQVVPTTFPGGYSFQKVVDLIHGRPDVNGYVKEMLPVILDVLGGVKLQPIDQTLEGQRRAQEKVRALKDLKMELLKIITNKKLFPEERVEQQKNIMEKIKTATQK
ncbi:MAG: hypothetical protein AAB922_03065 [Patescibacteria group bacterium]